MDSFRELNPALEVEFLGAAVEGLIRFRLVQIPSSEVLIPVSGASEMVCEELQILKAHCNEASAFLDAMSTLLKRRIGICSDVEFRALSREVDRAWSHLSSARRALHDHIVGHGCGEA
jgi:hypothetical protein